MTSPTTHVLFDCDGVLVDSEAIAIRVEVDLLGAEGFNFTPLELAERFVGLSYASMAKIIEEETGRPMPDGLMARIQDEVLHRFPRELRPVEGMKDLLAASTLPRCVASSSNLDRIRTSLDLTGLAPHFAEERIFSAQMVDRGKPEPDLFLFAAERMGADPAACLVVEDSPHGVTAGVRAGMTVIGLTAGAHAVPSLAARLSDAGAAHTVETAAELARFIVGPEG